MSESRKALVNHVFETFDRNALVDPQQKLLYAWQDKSLDAVYQLGGHNESIHMNQAISNLNQWAVAEELHGIGHAFYECEEPIMIYSGRLNRYEVANKYPSWRLHQYLHEFTHYWLLSSFSLGYDECKASVISPLTGHGPMFVRAFIMMLAKHHPAEIAEAELAESAKEAGVAVAAISGDELRELWSEWRTANFEFDNETSRDLIERTAALDRLEITGVRLP